MNLLYINISEYIPHCRDIHTLLPGMAFSRGKLLASTESTGSIDLSESDFFVRHPKMLADFFSSIFSLHYGDQKVNESTEIILHVAKLQHKKFKTKEDFKLIALGKKVEKHCRDTAIHFLRFQTILDNAERLNAFLKARSFDFTFIYNDKDESQQKDEECIMKFIAAFGEWNRTFILTEQIADAGLITDADSENFEKGFFENGILKTDLFQLPGFMNLQTAKLPLLREELEPELSAWHNAFDTLAKAASVVSFTEDNCELIKEIFAQSFRSHSDALKNKTDNSIYLAQLSNGEFGEYGGTFSLGITSRQHLIKALHHTRQFSKRVEEALLDYFGKDNWLDKTVCFILHTVPVYPPRKENIKPEEVSTLWEKSFQ